MKRVEALRQIDGVEKMLHEAIEPYRLALTELAEL